MKIVGPRLKCKLADGESKNTVGTKAIFCSISGCYCKHVTWQDGEYIQDNTVKECPKFKSVEDEL